MALRRVWTVWAPTSPEKEEVSLFIETSGDGPARTPMFSSLHLSKSGGLREADTLFQFGGNMRHLGSLTFAVVLVLNVVTLIKQARLTMVSGQQVEIQRSDFFEGLAALCGVDVNWFSPEMLVATFEMSALCFYALWIARHAAVIARLASKEYSGRALQDNELYQRWNSVGMIFMTILPQLQCFSAMRTLMLVAPSVLIPDFQALMFRLTKTREFAGAPRKLKVIKVCLFIVARLLLLFFGFQAFIVKFYLAAVHLPTINQRLWSLVQVLLFANQMVGVVQVNLYMRARLFRFIFGGVDGYMEHHEQQKETVWKAAFHRRAWHHHTVAQFLTVALTFNDLDFQRMVLDEKEKV